MVNLNEIIIPKAKIEELQNCLANCDAVWSIYDYDAMTIQELLCTFFTKINECIEISNLVLELMKWVIGEGLEKIVIEQLEKWLADGTLADIINKTIFKELNDKINLLIAGMKELETLVMSFEDRIAFLEDYFGVGGTVTHVVNSQPYYITQCETFKTTVSQGIGYDTIKQEFYMAQVYNNADWGTEVEHFVINRCDRHGRLIDSMRCKYGGHGTSFGLERVGEDIWIWTAWKGFGQCGALNKDLVVRIRYREGDIDLCQVPDYQIINTFNDVYKIPTVSSEGSLVALVEETADPNIKNVVVRGLNDLKTGVNKIIHQFNVDATNMWQGVTLDTKFLYFRVGNSTGSVPFQKDQILVYEMATGELVETVDIHTGEPINGFKEPEGICLIESNSKSSKTLLLATVKDIALRRVNQIWCIGHGDLGIQVLGSQNDKNMPHKDNGRCWQPPLGITKMSDITEIGWYYFNSTDLDKMLDKPQSGIGGWLQVSPSNDNGERFIQEFYSNTTNTINGFSVMRIVDRTQVGATFGWSGSAMELTLYDYKGTLAPVGSTIAFSEPLTNFDYIIIKYKFPGGDNAQDKLVALKYLVGDNITDQGFNITDSDNRLYFYESSIGLNAARTGATINRAVKVDVGGVSGSTTDYGVRRIIGVRL